MTLTINDRIRNRTVRFFNDVHINMKYDALASTFEFGFYFNENNQELKDMSCIGHYHYCKIEHEGQLLLTGNILSEQFDDSANPGLIHFSGYSSPGFLQDSSVTGSLQLQNSSLKDIVSKLITPFKLKAIYDSSVEADASKVYSSIACKPGQGIGDFLSGLCAQRNIVLSHDQKGNMVFRRAIPNRISVANFDKTKLKSLKMKTMFNGQGMHSDIIVIEQADFDEEVQPTKKQIKNPFVINTVYRPHVEVKTSGDTDNDAQKSVENVLARELKSLRFEIEVDRWDHDGRVVLPGDIITVKNPRVYLFNKTELFVEEVDLSGDTESQIAKYTCVVPSVYDGTSPKYIWKGINLH